MNQANIGFEESLALAMNHAKPAGTETVSAVHAAGRVVAREVFSQVDSPSIDASLKDGYAVLSTDIAEASTDRPVRLKVVDQVAAGGHYNYLLQTGETVRILTGAPVPRGADAVLTEEFTRKDGAFIYALADAHVGRNILTKGTDVTNGESLAAPGQMLTPALIGLLIAGGIKDVPVFKRPTIGLLATGSEIILPGVPMTPGKIFASNVGMQQAWFEKAGYDVRVMTAMDDEDQIAGALNGLGVDCDIIITSGGAWKGERDLTAAAITSLGGEMVFHRLRLGPGKATGMGILDHRPVFCLPGGPASNMAGFLMIVLPVLFKMSGFSGSPHLILYGTLEKPIYGQIRWTNLVQCDVIRNNATILLRPDKLKSRLWAMATQAALVVIPEGVEKMDAGDVVPFICLDGFFKT